MINISARSLDISATGFQPEKNDASGAYKAALKQYAISESPRPSLIA